MLAGTSKHLLLEEREHLYQGAGGGGRGGGAGGGARSSVKLSTHVMGRGLLVVSNWRGYQYCGSWFL